MQGNDGPSGLPHSSMGPIVAIVGEAIRGPSELKTPPNLEVEVLSESMEEDIMEED